MSIIRFMRYSQKSCCKMAGWKASFPDKVQRHAINTYMNKQPQQQPQSGGKKKKIRDFPQQRKYCSPAVILKSILCCTRRLGSTMELRCPTQHSPCGPKQWNKLIHSELFLLTEEPTSSVLQQRFSKEHEVPQTTLDHKVDRGGSHPFKGWHSILPSMGQPPSGSHIFILMVGLPVLGLVDDYHIQTYSPSKRRLVCLPSM